MPRKDSESSCSSHDSHPEENETLSNDIVLNKYQKAAEITNAVLKAVIAEVKVGAEVGVLCDLGDKLILEKTSQIFKKEKNVTKGIAMPTCISVDNCICHFSPLKSDKVVTLAEGQVVKIDLGTTIDGFVATAAHTVVVGASAGKKVSGKTADLIKATYDALEVAIRMLRPGNVNMDITAAIDKVAAEYGVTPIENMVSHQLEKNQIDGEKQIIQNPGEKQRTEMEKQTIDKFEAYALDILFSTGKGKPKDLDTRTTVYKRNEEVQYSLKMKASRAFYTECANKNGAMPFTLRSFEDETKAKMGVIECEKHGLVRPYQVLYEKEGDVVAQFKATILILTNGLVKVAGLPLEDVYEPTAKIQDPALLTTLKQSLKVSKKKNTEKTEATPAAPKA
ncbi:unnamed protein product [Auanema sp. JU1783]|nr:unnamed protein product [Auanema sp. JU1783]